MRRSGFAVDALCIVIFVVIGRSVHARGESVTGLLSTAWPFVVGLVVGWVIAYRWRDSPPLLRGIVISVSTVAVAMGLRLATGQGAAPAFVLVALGFLGASMCSWRVLVALIGSLLGRPGSGD